MKSFKSELNLNNKQRTLMAKHAGVARHAYNWGLATCIELHEKGEKRPSAMTLHKGLVAEVKSQYEWYYEVSKCAPQQALRDLERAFKNFFTVQGRGFPRFKKKGINDSFYLEGNLQIKGNQIKLPRMGWVKTYEKFLPPILIKSNSNVTISRKAEQWFISYKVDVEPQPVHHPNGCLGVDLGVKTLATLSNGMTFPSVKAYRKAQKKLASLQRSVSRKVKGSNNRKKAIKKLAKAHYQVACIRKDATHKLTSYLAKNHSEVVIEDLNVSGMLKNHRLAQAIADGGFYEFRRQLEYKCEWYGSQLTVVDRFYPSSKTCSDCGEIKKDLKLSDRTFICPSCGFFLDRDLNAAINLSRAGSSPVSACGVSSQRSISVERTPRSRKETSDYVQLSLSLSEFV
jgi:putative transposase